MENAADFTRPMILKFSNNMIYDLSDPVIGDSLRVTDIMKTMDNRIAIDEEALEHFVADQYIRETADRFRQKKLAIAQRKQKAAQKKSMDDLLDNARVLTPPPIAPVPEEDASPIQESAPQAHETGLIFYVKGGNGVSFRMQPGVKHSNRQIRHFYPHRV